MTGFMSSRFRHECASKGCYSESLPNWDWMFDGIFPRNIGPTDIDGMVEINGHFLFIEQKGEGVSLTTGQLRAFRALARKENITVLFLRPRCDGWDVLIYDAAEPTGWLPQTHDWLKNWLQCWAQMADEVAA